MKSIRMQDKLYSIFLSNKRKVYIFLFFSGVSVYFEDIGKFVKEEFQVKMFCVLRFCKIIGKFGVVKSYNRLQSGLF